MCPGSCFLGEAGVCGERLKVYAVKLPASIYHHDLWEWPISPNTLAEQHHTGTVARWIKGEIDREQPTCKRIHQKRGPGPTKRSPGTRADQFHVQQRMVEVPDFEWSIPMFWSCARQFPHPGFQRSRGPFSLAFEHLLVSRTLLDPLPESLVGRTDC